MAKKQPQILVVVSDLHCGSTVGLLPPGFIAADGNEIRQNRYQEWLWECWLDATGDYLRRMVGDDPFVLLINGDVIEGNHHGTTQIVSADVADHVEAAIECLEPLAKRAAQVHLTLGTECHTHSTEAGIGKKLGASKNPDTGKHAHSRLTFRINGCVCSATHHCSATSRAWLESGEYSRAMHGERAECLRAGWTVPDIIFRAHRHRAGFFTDNHSAMVVTGAWQGSTRHTHKAVPGAISEPTICVSDWRGRAEGQLPMVDQMVYAPKAPQVL